MNCLDPFISKGCAFGCGQCMPCRINRRRIWTHRIMLEAKEHVHNAFLTLTYSDENVPSDGNVDSVVLQRFIKRLRKGYSPATFRFYGVGEYGEDTNRPHYHVALFGHPTCHKGRTHYGTSDVCCPICTLVLETWALGHIFLGQLSPESAAYVAGYVTKKFIWYKDGLRPPFARMSNRPGIGAGTMEDVSSALLMEDYQGDDVPTSLVHDGKSWPLGRYLRRRLRTRMGRAIETPQSTMDEMAAQVSELREKAYSYAPLGSKKFAFKQEVISAGEGRRRKQAFWQRIRDQRRKVV